MGKEKHFNLRIDENNLAKFKIVCDYEARSMNGKLLIFIRDSICAFEKEHGEINLQKDTK